ncbi:MAG: hypothetical protein CM15mP74_01280 [Halieaceae bacterium]|nr:MAG: hypothetical protein CM15mP74_01280 [Halieaceae bacterium]
MDRGHRPVLLEEAIAALMVSVDGTYVDGTFGRGGTLPVSSSLCHHKDLCWRLIKTPRRQRWLSLFAQMTAGCDSDRQIFGRWLTAQRPAVFKVSCWISACPRLSLIIRQGIQLFPRWAARHAYGPEGGQSAADWLADVKEAELARVLKDWVRSDSLAGLREQSLMLVERGPFSGPPILLKLSRPRTQSGNRQASGNPSFQAIRLHINSELESLQDALSAALSVLAKGVDWW